MDLSKEVFRFSTITQARTFLLHVRANQQALDVVSVRRSKESVEVIHEADDFDCGFLAGLRVALQGTKVSSEIIFASPFLRKHMQQGKSP